MSRRPKPVVLSTEKEVVLVFPTESENRLGPVMRGLPGEAAKEMSVRVHEVADWFRDFDVKKIEVTISAGVESGSVTKLFISAKGQGGFTITLKPKKAPNPPTG